MYISKVVQGPIIRDLEGGVYKQATMYIRGKKSFHSLDRNNEG